MPCRLIRVSRHRCCMLAPLVQPVPLARMLHVRKRGYQKGHGKQAVCQRVPMGQAKSGTWLGVSNF